MQQSKNSTKPFLFVLPASLFEKVCQLLINGRCCRVDDFEQSFSKCSEDIVSLLRTCRYIYQVASQACLCVPLRIRVACHGAEYPDSRKISSFPDSRKIISFPDSRKIYSFPDSRKI